MVVSGAQQKTIEEIYQKKTQLEHILLRPDSYVGSVEAAEYRQIWLLNNDSTQMERRTVTVVPALYKIFDEILVNAADNKQRDPANMDTIKVDIDRENGEITVFNNGKGIPIQIHTEHQIYVPELIFGHLLTSSNYNDTDKKTTGGRNGYGAKLTNIYSTQFIVETNECNSGKYFRQVFKNNMAEKGEPIIKKAQTGKDWTRITFRPDFPKFGMSGFDDDIYDLMVKRVYDLAGCTDKSVKVYLNGVKLKINTFRDYINMHLPEGSETKRIYDASFDRWEVCVAVSDGSFEQVSFVNSIWTIKGGKHVDYVTDQIVKGAIASISKKKGAPKSLKPSHIRNHLFVFVNALIENPAFDSQTKETMTSNSKTFGSKYEISEALIKKILDVGLRDAVLSWSKFRETKDLKKNDGSKKSKILGIAKLDDANWAGTRQSQQCTLILTEGDSAKALAVSGLSIIGRDKYGVFPLKGKLLNVREASGAQILKNEEISNIKKILGLQQGVKYTDVSKLRYGHLMIMTDQDQDGSHIKGLLINFLHTFWPSLLKMNTFLSQFITPIVKATKGSQSLSFFTIPEYESWRLRHQTGWKIKYFKGLGTSTNKDAKEYFSAIDKHQVGFTWDASEEGKPNDDAIEKAFSKKRIEDRKTWLSNVADGTFIDYRAGSVSYEDFVDRELVLFSQSDNVRSIPSLLDGLKPGQRKIIYGCFKRKLTGEIKVAQLAGYVSEHSAYHHGEQSLTATIINLAQNYCGSNNVNLLLPIGQFGTRHCLGKDAASARYIFTGLSPVTRTLFPEQDDPLLEYLEDDGMSIEPKYYVPIIPLVLVNGAEGIGTGWSTSIPQHNPRDIVRWLQCAIRGDERRPVLTPWYKNFLGTITLSAEPGRYKKYEMLGVHERVPRGINILEIPVHKSTDSFKALLEEKDEKREILGFQARHTDIRVDFSIDVGDANECAMASATEKEILKQLKLSNSINTSNMILFDAQGRIRHYRSCEHILEEHFIVRNDLYILRKDHMMSVLERQCKRLDNKARFIKGCIRDEIPIRNVARAKVESILEEKQFDRLPPVSHDTTMVVTGNGRAALQVEGEDTSRTYDYLLNMPLLSLTKEKVEALLESLEDKKKEIVVLRATTPQQMWLDDLDKFVEVLDAHEAAERKDQNQADAVLAKKTKRVSPHTALIEAASARETPMTLYTKQAPDVFDIDAFNDETVNENTRSSVATSNSLVKMEAKVKAERKLKVEKSKSGDDELLSAAFDNLVHVAPKARPKLKLVEEKVVAKKRNDSDDEVLVARPKITMSLAERLAASRSARVVTVTSSPSKKTKATSKPGPSPLMKRSKLSSLSGSSTPEDPFAISDDDIMQSKLATKPKPSMKSVSAGATKKAPTLPRPKKQKAIVISSDDEDEGKVEVVMSSSDDAVLLPTTASRSRRTAVAEQPVYAVDSDDVGENSDDNDFSASEASDDDY